MGELTLSCLTPHGKEMKVAAKPAKKSWLVSASSWLANSMHGAHPLPTRESICPEISSSERGGVGKALVPLLRLEDLHAGHGDWPAGGLGGDPAGLGRLGNEGLPGGHDHGVHGF